MRLSAADRVLRLPVRGTTATIAQLRQLYAGTTFVIATDVVVSGRVNTSDAEENFYRTFCVEEDGAGLEVMAGIDQLHNDFPPGSRVTLRLKGLALGESRGILQVGRKPAAGSGFATDYLGSKAALDAAASRTGEAPQITRDASKPRAPIKNAGVTL